MYNIQIKNSIYKWRQSNKMNYNEYMNAKMKAYYQNNKAKCNAKRVLSAKYNRECCRLRNILL
jgi:hypothetical protein